MTAMQTFIVTIERLERRKVRMAASDIELLRHMLPKTLPEGARVLDVQPMGLPEASVGREILDHLLSRNFMALNGQPDAAVESWVSHAMKVSVDQANATLALAGMRVGFDRDGLAWLWIASAMSIPALNWWMKGLGRDASDLLPALQSLPGATRPRGMTFAGLKARAVGLPMSTVFPAGDA